MVTSWLIFAAVSSFLLLLGKKRAVSSVPAVPGPPPAILRALKTASARTGVPLQLLIGVAYTESRYRPRAISSAGAKGLMQLMPTTAASLGVTDPFNATQSALGGAKFLSALHRQYGSREKALAAYNWGQGNINRKPLSSQWPTSVRAYVTNVQQVRVA